MKPPYFRNIDLDIESKSSLRLLARELGERVTVMFSGRMKGRHCLFVEIGGAYKSLDAVIHAFCELIEGLSPEGQRVWDSAQRKEFDLGFDAQFASHRANRFKIRLSTLQRVAKVGAGLAVTLYRDERAEPDSRKMIESSRGHDSA